MTLDNIEKLCAEKKISIHKLEQEIGLGNATIRGWKSKTPRTDTLKKVADFFDVTVDELMGGKTPEQEVIEMAKQIQKDENLKILFDSTKDVSKEDLEIVAKVAKRMFDEGGEK